MGCCACFVGRVYIEIRKSGNVLTKKLNLKLSKHIIISKSQEIFQLILLPDIISSNIVAYSMQI